MGYCTVLGSIRAVDAGGQQRALVSAPQRRLLALLCLHAGRRVRSVMLEEHLALSPGALRTSIARLRRVIGTEQLVTRPAGYELLAAVDAREYQRLVDEAFIADAAEARHLLEKSERLWCGAPYGEFAHEPWAEVEAHRLRELHAAAIEELAVISLDAGDDTHAVDALIPLIDEHPYRDGPRALLIRALGQSGRSTEALREFHSYRLLLSRDVGTQPSQSLVELDRTVACGADFAVLAANGHPAWARRGRARRSPDRRGAATASA